MYHDPKLFKGLLLVSLGQFGHLNILLYSEEKAGTDFQRFGVMTNLDSIFKSRDVTLPTKVRLVKATVFPVVMYGCESWTKRKLSVKELMLLNCDVGKDF